MEQIGKRAVLTGVAAGLIGAPLVLVIIEALVGRVQWAETLGGAAVGTLFFAITGFVTWRFHGHENLQTLVLASYVVKMVPLVLVAAFVDFGSLNRTVAGLSVAAGGLAYVAAQTWVVALRDRRRSDASL